MTFTRRRELLQRPASFAMIVVHHDESHEHRRARFARIRRAKWLLRFTPRRARLHHYPLIGRFADVARKRSYLWSFRAEHVRPSLYAGAIIALMPIMGIQVPIAFGAALLLRSNVMILTGLQFISNPFTFVFVYYLGTYQLGKAIMDFAGFGRPAPTPTDLTVAQDLVAQTDMNFQWFQGVGSSLNALILGGVVAGTILGLILDLLWRFAGAQAAAHKAKVAARKHHSDSTPPAPESS